MDHYRSEHGIYSCYKCASQYSDPTQLWVHLTEVHNFPVKDMYCGHNCRKDFLSVPNLNLHLAGYPHQVDQYLQCAFPGCIHSSCSWAEFLSHQAREHEQTRFIATHVRHVATTEQMNELVQRNSSDFYAFDKFLAD